MLCLVVALLAGFTAGLGVSYRGDDSKAEAVTIRGERYEYATNGVYKFNAERVVAEGVGWDWGPSSTRGGRLRLGRNPVS